MINIFFVYSVRIYYDENFLSNFFRKLVQGVFGRAKNNVSALNVVNSF